MLKMEHVTKKFGQVKVLDDWNLEIHEGEIFSLLGPSGCGKTTTLRLIAGLESADDGSIFLNDRPVVAVGEGIFVPVHQRNIGMVFQSYAIWPHMTVFENVAYPLKIRRLKKKDIRQKVSRALDLVGLAGLENRQAPMMSGGQQQRVALARALVYEPSLLLLDEPFSNLDAKLRQGMRAQLKRLLKRVKITVVLVTHDQIEALSLSDRIAVMHAGRAEQVGLPADVYDRPRTPFVRDFLGNTFLLRGRVTGSSEGKTGVQLDGFPETKIMVPCSDKLDLNASSRVFVAVRPEDLQISTSNDGPKRPDCITGTVESLLFVGEYNECLV
ncbi:MAG: ABC transporter ATP-binding protein, partial [Desulfobacterales bacterium]|nr:ABC transporter ATP-binding protein [Desulfobacterales bacterium]